jgi:hypothetical protein
LLPLILVIGVGKLHMPEERGEGWLWPHPEKLQPNPEKIVFPNPKKVFASIS